MRTPAFALLTLLLSPVVLSAQAVDTLSPRPSGPAVSFTLDRKGDLPRLGFWLPVNDRLSLGLEVEGAVQSRNWLAPGSSTRYLNQHDWRLAVGPSALARLARVGPLDLIAYASASYGVHAFNVREAVDDDAGPADRGFGLRGGLGAEWRLTERWGLDVLYVRRWTSEPGLFGSVPRDAYRGSGLTVSVKFIF